MSISVDLWNDLPAFPQKEEIVEELFAHENIRVERIISSGQTSPSGFWYDQDENEWLILLSGAAEIALLDPDEVIKLKPGNSYFIPAHRKHRVNWTAPKTATLWLVVFFSHDKF